MREIKVACKRAATALVLDIEPDRVTIEGPSFAVHVDGKPRRLGSQEINILALTSVAATLCLGSDGDAALPDDLARHHKCTLAILEKHLFNTAALAHGLLRNEH